MTVTSLALEKVEDSGLHSGNCGGSCCSLRLSEQQSEDARCLESPTKLSCESRISVSSMHKERCSRQVAALKDMQAHRLGRAESEGWQTP